MRRPSAPPTLSAFDIGCVVVGGIIGVGIFFTPRSVARAVDSATEVLLAWSVGGVIAMLGALVFAELSARVPGYGGTFAYLHRAYGRLPAFLYGWANWLVIQAGALAVIGLVMVDYAETLVFGGPRAAPGTKAGIAAAAIAAFTMINAVGLRVGRGVQNALTLAKVVAVFALVTLGLAFGSGAGETAPSEPAERTWFAGLAAALLPVLFSFGGWQQGSFVGGAARRPRDVALGIVGGVLVVVVAYLAVNLAFLSLLGFDGAREADAIGAAAARAALEPIGAGEFGSRALAGMVVLSSLGIINTICLAPPFVLHEMAQRGLFPAAVGRLHPTRRTPVVAVLVQGLWGSLLCIVAQLVVSLRAPDASAQNALGFLLDGVVFVDWLFFALCGEALLRLRARGAGESVDGFRSPAGGLVGRAFTIAAIAVMLGGIWQSPGASLTGLTLCALGLPVYRRLSARATAG